VNTTVFLLYYLSIVAAVVAITLKYKHLDRPVRILAFLLCVTAVSEFFCYFAYSSQVFTVRNAVYHFYSIIQAVLYSLYFIYALKPYLPSKYVLAVILIWITVGMANAACLQPLTELNTNMLLLESFAFITLSLYYIYNRITIVDNGSVLREPKFIFAIIFLINWASTLFFWATIKILYRSHWKYIQTMMDMQVLIGTLVYTSIAVTITMYPKKKTIENI